MDWFSLPTTIATLVIQMLTEVTGASHGPAKPSGMQPMAYVCEITDTGFTQGDDGQLSCEWRFVK
jgi:hypothetical protein